MNDIIVAATPLKEFVLSLHDRLLRTELEIKSLKKADTELTDLACRSIARLARLSAKTYPDHEYVQYSDIPRSMLKTLANCLEPCCAGSILLSHSQTGKIAIFFSRDYITKYKTMPATLIYGVPFGEYEEVCSADSL